MNEELDQLLAAELKQLKEQFRDQLQEDLSTLRRVCEQDDATLMTAQSLRQWRDFSHRLAGSTLTFGYETLGRALQNLERTLDTLIAGSAVDSESLRTALKHLPGLEGATPQAPLPHSGALNSENDDRPRLLVLEADPTTGELLQTGLSSFGYRVERFTSGSAIQEAFTREWPDALLIDIATDCEGPQNALAVGTALNELSGGGVPVLVINERQGFSQKLEAARSGAKAFFSKPVNIPALETHLDYLLRQKISDSYRVLLVDDDNYSLSHYRLLLQAYNVEVHSLSNPSDIIPAMEDFHPELLVFDLHMPECSGVELAQIVRYHEKWVHIPIIFLSAEQNQSRQLGALLQGGDGFLAKPVNADYFVSTIISHAQRARKLAELMSRDSLTGLLKHSEIKERLNQEVARATRDGHDLSVAMIDIDRFKRINDTYGHQAGDVVISALAHLLRHGLRISDIIGRYGGEEFLVLLPATAEEGAAKKLDALRDEFSQIPFRQLDADFHASFSAGLATLQKDESSQSIVARVDEALYRAKQSGRNRIALG